MIRKIALKVLWHISWRLGYGLQDRIQKPIQVYGNDPRELQYLVNLPFTQIQLPTVLGSGLRFFPLSGKTYHPFLLALKSASASNNQVETVSKILRKYNETVNLQTANDFLGLDQLEAVFSESSHPYEYTYPWSALRPEKLKDFVLLDIYEENKRYGLTGHESLDLGLVSKEKIAMETARLVHLRDSIEKNGFKQQKDEDPIGGFVLIDKEKWRWIVQGGQHRAAVLASLGYENIPVYIKQVVRREDVCYWPNVQSGIFTKKQALMVFDKLFAAEPPPVAKDWVDYINKTFYYEMNVQ